MKVGIFDSGIGGLTVLNEALKMMPDEDYIYFADTFNVPYGTKPKDNVKEFIFNIVEFLDSKCIDVLLIACNTATSIGVDELRSKYSFPIIGMEPAVKYALTKNDYKKVLVLATPLTLILEKYKKLVEEVDVDMKVESLALPELVDFAEDYVFDRNIIREYLSNQFSHYNLDEFGAIVLGCTHFIYYKELIRDLIPSHIKIVDGNNGTIKHMKSSLTKNSGNKGSGRIEFYQSTREGIRVTEFDKYMIKISYGE